ncbi:5-methylthioadenosine/S-adenosylhomocysteine deaminase [Alkalithermobacter thermoalcaliphilus JW-YL-7 = DSM 7308]|uniref:5-methylthioadenosine/S-adenosylhomocysteine deaminase n=1 Tax=Alkalithermobacter thermoalcaliphilus JW-YL-7 = DSM 7308 TaxID=1121328 RepID=A0A150FRH2_CLOPD|nr:5-methylthioadenosine/S-adenosylhomocysteine deaminase [[Clostridium] paradoxum JW-YL-7 = DSM 7308]SHK43028.1 5-methylthioadenosine/S-adenosylhomocysteine deaminase [[Clostridium] paradoxum JW-YL-7 = DSM 7308]
MKILIKDVDIIQYNEEIEVKKSVFVGIENDTIKFISEKKLENFNPDYEIDGKNKLLLPGFINSHTHLPMSLLRNVGSDTSLMDWLYNHIFPKEKTLTKEHIYYGSILTLAEMIKCGTTGINDMYFLSENVCKAAYDSGIRASIGVSINGDILSENIKQEIKQVYSKYHNLDNGRIQVAIAPHAMYTCSKEFLIDSLELAKQLNVSIHTHIAETKTEYDYSIEKYGVSPVKYFDELGYFDIKVMAAHCVHLDDEDIDIISNKKVICLHNPSSNLKLASGFSPIHKIIAKQGIVTIGTDGCASNNNVNIIEEMHIASLIHKGYNMDPMLVKASEVLKMATQNGKHIFGIDNMGNIREGYKADLVMIDMNKPHLYPNFDTVSNIVYSAQGSDVDTVIVDGKILMEKRQLKTIDLEKLYFEINKLIS